MFHDEWIKAQENAKRPKHYQGKRYELWDVILDFNLGYFEANIMKYVVRWKRKNGLEDLYKAQQYLNKLIVEEEGKTILTPTTETIADD
jgi:hypothetical protein